MFFLYIFEIEFNINISYPKAINMAAIEIINLTRFGLQLYFKN